MRSHLLHSISLAIFHAIKARLCSVSVSVCVTFQALKFGLMLHKIEMMEFNIFFMRSQLEVGGGQHISLLILLFILINPRSGFNSKMETASEIVGQNNVCVS